MNISIDIDGVLVDREKYQIKKGKTYAKSNNLNCTIKNPFGYNVDQIFGWEKQDFNNFWDKYLWDYTSLKPIKNVRKIITKLKNDGHTILINTSRWLSEQNNAEGEKMRETVKNWFLTHKIPYDKLIFACGNKLSSLNKFSIDCHIEDNPKEAQPFVELNIPVVMFNAKYNQNYKGRYIYHANSWRKVYKIINQIANKNDNKKHK